jgi:hypothetical protein
MRCVSSNAMAGPAVECHSCHAVPGAPGEAMRLLACDAMRHWGRRVMPCLRCQANTRRASRATPAPPFGSVDPCPPSTACRVLPQVDSRSSRSRACRVRAGQYETNHACRATEAYPQRSTPCLPDRTWPQRSSRSIPILPCQWLMGHAPHACRAFPQPVGRRVAMPAVICRFAYCRVRARPRAACRAKPRKDQTSSRLSCASALRQATHPCLPCLPCPTTAIRRRPQ